MKSRSCLYVGTKKFSEQNSQKGWYENFPEDDYKLATMPYSYKYEFSIDPNFEPSIFPQRNGKSFVEEFVLFLSLFSYIGIWIPY